MPGRFAVVGRLGYEGVGKGRMCVDVNDGAFPEPGCSCGRRSEGYGGAAVEADCGGKGRDAGTMEEMGGRDLPESEAAAAEEEVGRFAVEDDPGRVVEGEESEMSGRLNLNGVEEGTRKDWPGCWVEVEVVAEWGARKDWMESRKE